MGKATDTRCSAKVWGLGKGVKTIRRHCSNSKTLISPFGPKAESHRAQPKAPRGEELHRAK